MYLPIELDPATETRLREKAEALHEEPEVLAAQIIRRAMEEVLPRPPEDRSAKIAAALRELDELNREAPMPALSEDAFCTESYYQDHY